MSKSLTFIQTISAAPTVIYQHLTNHSLQWIWLSYDAVVHAEVGKTFHLAWETGNHYSGNYTALEQDKRVAMTWQGRGMPVETQVEITLKADGDCTTLELRHSGLEAEHEAQIKQLWETSLENLKYTVETGLDYRLMSRPMLGIMPGQLTDKHIETMNLPVKEGLLITGVVAGMGAEACGLQANDVIVSLDGQLVKDFWTLRDAVLPHKGGDTVEVVFYRETEKHTVQMLLSKRPLPEWPLSLPEIVEKLEQMHAEVDKELDELVASASNDEMSQRPATAEWSGNENLAHLIWSERWLHSAIWGMNSNNNFMEWPSNDNVHIAGIVAAYPTSEALAEELKRAETATRAMVAALGENVVKAFVATVALAMEGNAPHKRSHFQQIKDTLMAVRQGAGVVS